MSPVRRGNNSAQCLARLGILVGFLLMASMLPAHGQSTASSFCWEVQPKGQRFDLAQHRGVGLQEAQALGHAVARDHAAGEFLEGLLEHALALVGGEHRLIKRHAVERGEALARHALGGGFFLEVGQEGVEAARRIAGGAESRRANHG